MLKSIPEGAVQHNIQIIQLIPLSCVSNEVLFHAVSCISANMGLWSLTQQPLGCLSGTTPKLVTFTPLPMNMKSCTR
jgi:hypothetical protein